MSSVKKKHSGEYFYYLESNAKILGNIEKVYIALIKRNNGNLQFYNYILPPLERVNKKKEDTLVSTEPESQKEPSASPSVNVSSGKKLADINANVKKNSSDEIKALKVK